MWGVPVFKVHEVMYCMACLLQMSMSAQDLTDVTDAPTFPAPTDVNAMMATTTLLLPEPALVSPMPWANKYKTSSDHQL